MFFLPHSVCLALDPYLLWLHVTADALTAAAYYSIPLAIMIIATRRREARYRWVAYLFAAFVLACGTTHVMAIVTLWQPIYWVQGWLKAVTALVSVATAVVMWPLIPKVLALPTPAELEREIAERTAAETEVRRINRDLERLVGERTQALTRAKDDAERANAAKSRFLAAASHDLRQPFQALRLFLDVLEQRVIEPAAQPVVGMAVKALEGGESLLHALLDLSTLQAGTVGAKPVEFPVADVLRQIQVEWQPVAADKGLELRVRPSAAVVHSDPVLLQRLVRNLVANAVRYTDSGGIMVACRRLAGRTCVEIWDTGIGIPESAQAEIFEEFTQLGNPERDRTKGLGLGLAIVRRLAHLLFIEIEVLSRPGRGSLFRLYLPDRLPDQISNPTPSNAGAAASA